MSEFQLELERKPEADLLAMFPVPYRREHRRSQYLQLSHAAKINLQTLHNLRDTLKDEPEVYCYLHFRQITTAGSIWRLAQKGTTSHRWRYH